jgi:polyhydroxyalkanoate synthesis regulator phasin
MESIMNRLNRIKQLDISKLDVSKLVLTPEKPEPVSFMDSVVKAAESFKNAAESFKNGAERMAKASEDWKNKVRRDREIWESKAPEREAAHQAKIAALKAEIARFEREVEKIKREKQP